MVVGKLPFTALTDGVTGEATEPPHLVSVITGFHRSKEGTKQQIQLSSETGRGCAGLGRKSQQLRIPPRPAPPQLCILTALLGTCPVPFLSVFPHLRTLCPASHRSVRRAAGMKSKLLRYPRLLHSEQPVFCFRGALSTVMSENLPEHSRIHFRDNAEGTQNKTKQAMMFPGP